ncbi:acyl carrier protein [Paraburkholderia acidisoli]|uniref:Acyl carrier protein n=1 Tax=Paraburkholderia acidisoli TaxID=2571748 RepID=A0A7Z2GRT1_9BURK|nr:acyl carrier protein [Paraburkholderia acidisoli]QGZ66308.1 acyl carrier protein [Paraburkholderia acidisoli]QGZ66394.1 acyl carrier protein [Paraburkholderia acidisoli]
MSTIHQGNISERLKKCIAEITGLNAEEIADTSSFADLGCDSIELLEIVMAVEDEFGIEVSDDDGDKLKTVQQAIDYVTAKV